MIATRPLLAVPRAATSAVALVTGAAGAIGTAIVQALARAGMTLVLVDRDGEGLLRTATLAGDHDRHLVIEADLTRVEAAAEIMRLVRDSLGLLDHLVNNAGLSLPQSIFEVSTESWDTVMAVNLRAPMLLAREAIPFWRERAGGNIVNIGSRVWASGAVPAYTASKAGVVGLTRSLAVELAPLGVRANVVAPSYVDTPLTRLDRSAEDLAARQTRALGITPLGRFGTPDDMANAVAFLISDAASFITGEVLHVCGGAQLAARA